MKPQNWGVQIYHTKQNSFSVHPGNKKMQILGWSADLKSLHRISSLIICNFPFVPGMICRVWFRTLSGCLVNLFDRQNDLLSSLSYAGASGVMSWAFSISLQPMMSPPPPRCPSLRVPCALSLYVQCIFILLSFHLGCPCPLCPEQCQHMAGGRGKGRKQNG